MTLSIEVLPAPFGPIMARISPPAISKETSVKALTPPNERETFSTERSTLEAPPAALPSKRRPPPPAGGRSARFGGPGGGGGRAASTASVLLVAPPPPHPGLPAAVRPSPSRG